MILQRGEQAPYIYRLLPLQHHTNVEVTLSEAKAIFGGAKQLQPRRCASETAVRSTVRVHR